jgi:hypothetical protein
MNYKKINTHFINNKPNISIDDQIYPVKDDKYETKDYKQFVEFSFPRFTINSYIPNKFKDKPLESINKFILGSIQVDTNYTNKTLSYMRRDVIVKRMMKCIIDKLEFDTVVDCTANIGGDTLSFGMLKNTKHIYSYEMQSNVYMMLKNNINLYGLNDKITAYNTKYDYSHITDKTLVFIDPPFEISNNADHFNLSIEKAPLYTVVEKLFSLGAKYVVCSLPLIYKYNKQYAIEHKHNMNIIMVANKDVKFLVISRGEFNPKCYTLVGGGKKSNSDDTYHELYECKLLEH